MADNSPTASRSMSKDSIGGGGGDNVPRHSEDEYEDSLNVSISEHISEDIESNNNISNATDDSIEKPYHQFDRSVVDKKRQLFAFDDSDKSDAVGNERSPTFTRFRIDEDLSGDNIARHFLAESSHSEHVRTTEGGKSGEKSGEKSSQTNSPKSSLKSNENSGKTAGPSTSPKECEKPKDLSGGRHQGGDCKLSHNKDVILINDHEISIDSLKQQQQQQKRKSDSDQANTTSDISDLMNEENAKESKSMEDVAASSAHEPGHSDNSAKSESDHSQSDSDKIDDDNEQEDDNEQTNEYDDIVQKCRPMETDSIAELSVIDEVSRDDESSGKQRIVESNSDKQNVMRQIIDDTVQRLPIDKENRAPNLRDELTSIESKYLASSQNSTTTDGTVYNAFGKSDVNISMSNELNHYLTNIESKIKELHSVDLARLLGNDASNSRRDSLKDSLKDLPQSSREAISITTTSTEYRPFQDEYFRVSWLIHVTSEFFALSNQYSPFH